MEDIRPREGLFFLSTSTTLEYGPADGIQSWPPASYQQYGPHVSLLQQSSRQEGSLQQTNYRDLEDYSLFLSDSGHHLFPSSSSPFFDSNAFPLSSISPFSQFPIDASLNNDFVSGLEGAGDSGPLQLNYFTPFHADTIPSSTYGTTSTSIDNFPATTGLESLEPPNNNDLDLSWLGSMGTTGQQSEISNPSSSSMTTPTSPRASPVSKESSKETPARVTKRQLNTLAARRYRQRRLDQVKNLEAELEKVQRERDELKLRVSKLEGETEALRNLLNKSSK